MLRRCFRMPAAAVLQPRRSCSSAAHTFDNDEVELIEQFTEARELIEEAKESHGTTYFAEDLREATEHVKKTNDAYHALKGRMAGAALDQFVKRNELKFRQLDAELQQLMHLDS